MDRRNVFNVCIQRLDIFSIGDIALRKAISDIYNVNKDDFKKFANFK